MPFVDAYDKRTGKKLPQQVPEQHLRIFANALSPTPRQKAADKNPAPTAGGNRKKEAPDA